MPGMASAQTRESGHVHVHAASQPVQSGELLFFSDQEDALLDRLAEMIIPADSRSGGAHDAQVSRDIDHVMAYSEARVQDEWRAQLKAVDEEAKRRFGKIFLQCDAVSQDALMAGWAKNEKDPKTELEKFFVLLKRSTAAGYYTSEIGVLKELGYKGNAVVKEFTGCKQPCKICSL
jgi:gluconate 2-dehydrogenase gamma chain